MISEEQVMKVIKQRKIERYKSGDRDPKLLSDILDYLTQNNDEELLAFIMENDHFDDFRGIPNIVNIFENIIINNGKAWLIYAFALRIKGANIAKLEGAIAETKDGEYIYRFAKNVEGATISKLEDAIIETKDARYIFYFASFVKGAAISKLEDAIIETKNAEYIYKFAQGIEGANIIALKRALMEMAEKNPEDSNVKEYVEQFNSNEHIRKIEQQQFILEKQNAENIIPFAMTIILEKQNRKEILDKLIDNIDKENNMLKLQVYSEFLNGHDDEDMEQAFGLDKEYTVHVKSKRKK